MRLTLNALSAIAGRNRRPAPKPAGPAKPKQPAKTKRRWNWSYDDPHVGGISSSVLAHTRSEARAEIKRELMIPAGRPLPADVAITEAA